jgi:hypothetical protein
LCLFLCFNLWAVLAFVCVCLCFFLECGFIALKFLFYSLESVKMVILWCFLWWMFVFTMWCTWNVFWGLFSWWKGSFFFFFLFLWKKCGFWFSVWLISAWNIHWVL